MAKIDLGLILPPTGTLIYSDNVQMNYSIPTAVSLSGKHELFSVVSDEKGEEDNGE